MSDLKMEGKPISVLTGCRVGHHVFTEAGAGVVYLPSPSTRCSCGAYSWKEWEAHDARSPEPSQNAYYSPNNGAISGAASPHNA